MVTDNEHLKNPNKSGYRSNRNTGQFFRGGRYKPAEYDPSKISIIDEKNKSVRKKNGCAVSNKRKANVQPRYRDSQFFYETHLFT